MSWSDYCCSYYYFIWNYYLLLLLLFTATCTSCGNWLKFSTFPSRPSLTLMCSYLLFYYYYFNFSFLFWYYFDDIVFLLSIKWGQATKFLTFYINFIWIKPIGHSIVGARVQTKRFCWVYLFPSTRSIHWPGDMLGKNGLCPVTRNHTNEDERVGKGEQCNAMEQNCQELREQSRQYTM